MLGMYIYIMINPNNPNNPDNPVNLLQRCESSE